jgi:hypothetical protein
MSEVAFRQPLLLAFDAVTLCLGSLIHSLLRHMQ